MPGIVVAAFVEVGAAWFMVIFFFSWLRSPERTLRGEKRPIWPLGVGFWNFFIFSMV